MEFRRVLFRSWRRRRGCWPSEVAVSSCSTLGRKVRAVEEPHDSCLIGRIRADFAHAPHTSSPGRRPVCHPLRLRRGGAEGTADVENLREKRDRKNVGEGKNG